MQLYVPPEVNITKDFLKDVLSEKKSLFLAKDVRLINVPAYDELSIKNLMPQMMNEP